MSIITLLPPKVVPRKDYPTLTSRQLRRMLLQIGMTEDDVDNMIASMPDPTIRAAAKIDWKHASSYERTHELVATLGAAAGFTDEQVDTMWMYASDI